MYDFENFLKMMDNANYEFTTFIDKGLDNNVYRCIGFKDKLNELIYIAQFDLNMKLVEIYLDDDYKSLDALQKSIDTKLLDIEYMKNIINLMNQFCNNKN